MESRFRGFTHPVPLAKQPGMTKPDQSGGRSDVYKETGVDTAEADAGLNHIIARVQRTWPRAGLGRVVLPIGYFANVIELDGVGLALCTDGVGSKTMIADMMGKYDTIGIDCVAMNVNDLICVGAKPLSLVDYIAVERTDAAMLDAIGVGLCEGARAGRRLDLGRRDRAAQGRDQRLRPGRHGGRPVALDKVIDGGARARGRRRHRRAQQRRAQQRPLARAQGVLRRPPLRRRAAGSTSSPARSARSCCARPTSTCPRRWRSSREVRGVKALANITGDGLLNLAARRRRRSAS